MNKIVMNFFKKKEGYGLFFVLTVQGSNYHSNIFLTFVKMF